MLPFKNFLMTCFELFQMWSKGVSPLVMIFRSCFEKTINLFLPMYEHDYNPKVSNENCDIY